MIVCMNDSCASWPKPTSIPPTCYETSGLGINAIFAEFHWPASNSILRWMSRPCADEPKTGHIDAGTHSAQKTNQEHTHLSFRCLLHLRAHPLSVSILFFFPHFVVLVTSLLSSPPCFQLPFSTFRNVEVSQLYFSWKQKYTVIYTYIYIYIIYIESMIYTYIWISHHNWKLIGTSSVRDCIQVENG